MKRIFTIMIAFLMASCTKENVKQKNLIQNHQILGKWQFVSELSSWDYHGCVYINDKMGEPSDTWIFQPDGILLKNEQKNSKTDHYAVINDITIYLDGYDMEIKQLGVNNEIRLHYEKFTQGNGNTIGNIFLKK